MQIAAVMLGGPIAAGTMELTSAQEMWLAGAMFCPGVILLLFCALKKIPLRSVGLRPFKLRYWPVAFGIIALMIGAGLLSVIGFCDYPRFTAGDGGWSLRGAATIFGQPNPPPMFVLNMLLSSLFGILFCIPQALGEELAYRGR